MRTVALAAALALTVAACASSDEADAVVEGVGDTVVTTASTIETAESTSNATAPTTEGTALATTTIPTTTAENTAPDADAGSAANTILVEETDGTALDEVHGELTAAGQQDVYTFEVTDGQSFIVHGLGDCVLEGATSLAVDVAGAASSTVFLDEQDVSANADCDGVDRFDVDESGSVVLTVSDTNEVGTGTYNFEVLDVTDDPAVPLEMGDSAGPDAPLPGAGQIESIGRHDAYTFDVTDGQSFVVRGLGGCEFDGDDSLAIDIAGVVSSTVFLDEADLDAGEDCDAITRFDATETGTVVMTVAFLDEDATGTYGFAIDDVTDDPAIPLASGTTVGDGVPVAGAGNIEDVGRNDVYTLEVAEGDAITIEQLGGCSFTGGDDSLAIDVSGVASGTVFLDDGECTSVDTIDVDEAGTVVLRAEALDNDTTGTYGVRVTVASA